LGLFFFYFFFQVFERLCMAKTVAYFNHMVSSSLVPSILIQCNRIIANDVGAHLGLVCLPDLVIICINDEGVAVGLLVLQFTPRTRAWEIGSMAASRGCDRTEIMEILINGAYDAIRAVQARGGFDDKVWLVKRVRGVDVKRKALFAYMGFEHAADWTEGVLSNDGYIPFDPFDTILMKRVIQA
jgi:hypothetical protein